MKKIGVALLGLGVVGGGVYEILTNKREMIKAKDGVDIEIVKVLERNLDRCAQLGVDKDKITQNIDDITSDDNIQVVAEFFGGVEPAKTFLKKALASGKSIVTANKEMLSKSFCELEEVASKSGAGIYFEASCVGGVPVIRTLCDAMQANEITSLKGIVNGTTNYILSKMSDEGMDYQTCLLQAQQLGYAEANPTADVDGFDAMYKNSILSSLAYRKKVSIDNIFREGISNVSVEDIKIAKSLGYEVKLLAISSCNEGNIEARVHPTLIPLSHPLASVKGAFNALYIHGDSVDDVMLYGRGAGALPTGSAIVSDIVFCAKQTEHRRFEYATTDCEDVHFAKDFECGHYLHLEISHADVEKCKDAFAKHGIEVKKSVEKPLENGKICMIFITKKGAESRVERALCDIKNVAEVCAMIRVEE